MKTDGDDPEILAVEDRGFMLLGQKTIHKSTLPLEPASNRGDVQQSGQNSRIEVAFEFLPK